MDWIVQFDAPQDPAMFVHRIGRTGRAGETGRTLLFVDPTEAAYLPFLEGRGIELQPLPKDVGKAVSGLKLSQIFRDPQVPSSHVMFPSEDKGKSLAIGSGAAWEEFPWTDGVPKGKQADAILCTVTDVPVEDLRRAWEICRALNVIDHNLLDLQGQAFVSIARAYREHQLRFIFLFEELCLADLAVGMGALRLQRVKEIVGKYSGFKQSRIDPDKIPWLGRDSAAILKRRLEQREVQERKKQRRVKKLAKANAAAKKLNQHQRRKRKREKEEDDAEKNLAEERAHKKVKKGKMTKEEFDAKFDAIPPMETAALTF